MAAQQQQQTLPPPNIAWVEKDGKPSLSFRILKTIIDALQRLTGNNAVLIAVAAPLNANAAAAGVHVGQLYRDTADPSKVYIRTV
jgi:hypothetical protein